MSTWPLSNLQRKEGVWPSRWVFILATTGSAVGLGNIWRFPYVVGENGGGTFIFVYLVCLALIALPILMAEMILGRRGRMSPINTMKRVAEESNVSRGWSGIAWSATIAGILILSFYSVIAGWALHYLFLSISGELQQISAVDSSAQFDGFLGNIGLLVLWHSIFMAMVIAIVAMGVVKGLGRMVSLIVPILFALLLFLLVYSAAVGDFSAAWNFMFSFNSEKLQWSSILDALGHAFFALSLGMGAMMAYGAYMPAQKFSLSHSMIVVALLDTLFGLLVGLVIFSVVFADPLADVSAGPGLLFVSLPVIFGQMEGGIFFATLFFLLVIISALSSAVSIIEPAIAWLLETREIDREDNSKPSIITSVVKWLTNSKGPVRRDITCKLGGIIWLFGLGTVFSFNWWSEFTIAGMTFFELLGFVTANFMLPLGGFFLAIFIGWKMQSQYLVEELGDIDVGIYRWWLRIIRFVSPVLILLVFVLSLWDKLF